MEKVWSDFLLVFWSNNTRVIENPYCHYCDWLMSVLCYGEKHALSQRKCWTMWAFELCARWCWKESWITTTVCVKCLRNILILQYIYHFVLDFLFFVFPCRRVYYPADSNQGNANVMPQYTWVQRLPWQPVVSALFFLRHFTIFKRHSLFFHSSAVWCCRFLLLDLMPLSPMQNSLGLVWIEGL